MFSTNDKDKMHPEDMRNLVYFFVIAACLYFVYDAFILKPQADALKQQQIVQAQILKNLPAPETAKTDRPRAVVLAASPRIKLDNGKISGTISLIGSSIDDISLDEYFDTIEHKNKVILLSPKDTEFPRHVMHGWVAEGSTTKVPDDKALWRAEGNDKLTQTTPVTLVWDNGQGLRFENIYSIDDDYMITLTQKVANNSGSNVTLHSYGLVSQTGLSPDFAPIWVVHEGPIGFMGGELHLAPYFQLRSHPFQEFTGSTGWAGITDKYWLTALVPPQGQEVHYRYNYTGTPPRKSKEKDAGRYQADYVTAPVSISPGQTAQVESRIFAGAKKVITLEAYAKNLNIPNFDLAVDFGWFWFLSKPFFYVLHFFSTHTNIGIGMIMMTVLLRAAVFPLTNISYKSFAKMKKVAPQVAELRKTYGADKAVMQAELVKLYEREGVNPLAGCLPAFVQIPIFFSLYKVLVNTIEMRQAPFFGWIHDMSAPDPTNVFTLFGLIHWNPPEFLHHVGVWPCMLLVCFLVQRRLNPPPADPVQRDMALYFPFLMTYMMSRFASGLVIYWTLGAVLGITQQIVIMRRLGVPIYLFGEEAPAPVSGVHPLAAMAEKDVEEALFGDDDEPKTISPPKPRRKKKK